MKETGLESVTTQNQIFIALSKFRRKWARNW